MKKFAVYAHFSARTLIFHLQTFLRRTIILTNLNCYFSLFFVSPSVCCQLRNQGGRNQDAIVLQHFFALLWAVRLKTNNEHWLWQKNGKFWFFQFFFKQIILFLFEFEFYMQNDFFWGIACWNSSKITEIWILGHF